MRVTGCLTSLLLVTLEILLASEAAIAEQLYEIVSNDLLPGDEFGWSVDIDGGTAVVGAPGRINNSESAYLFDVATGAQIRQLGFGGADDRFGNSVGIDGRWAVVGAPDLTLGPSTGSAFLYDLSTGAAPRRLSPSDGVAGMSFGHAVDIDGDRVIVGAYRDTELGAVAGAAYVFDANTGQQLHKLLPADGLALNFGWSVALDGDRAIVGTRSTKSNNARSGSAYVFDISNGQQLTKFLPNITGDTLFGESVGILGDTAVVGSPYDSTLRSRAGATYLFDISTGDLITKLTNPEVPEQFGVDVAIHDDRLLVGAYRDAPNGRNSGAAYLYDLRSLELLEQLLPDVGASGELFGRRVEFAGDTAIVGTWPVGTNASASSSAYLFRVVPEPPTVTAVLIALGVCIAAARNGRQ